MKIYKYYLLSFLTLGVLFHAKATEDVKRPPLSLNAERTWIDQVHLSWGQPSNLKKSNTEKLPWKIAGSFNPKVFISNTQQASPVSDGEFIYVASWHKSETSVFYQYDMNGKYLNQFTIEGLIGSVRDIAFDGTYFYGGVQNINSVFVMDFNTKKVVKTIPVDLSKFAMRDRDLRHFSYIPTLNNSKGGLELGSSSHSFLIDLEGNIIEDSALLFKDPCYSTSYHNGFIYAFTEPITNAAGNGKTIVEYDATTFAPTGRILDLRDFQQSEELPLLENSHFPSGMEFIESPNGRMLALCGLQSGLKNLIVKLEVERATLPNGMLGYNIYRNGTKINNSGLEPNTLEFTDKNAIQGVDYTYAVKAVYQAGESEAATTTIKMTDTRQLPFFENFESYYYTTGFWNVKDTSGWIHTRMSIAGSTEKYIVLANFDGFSKDTSRIEDYLVSRPLTTLGMNKILLRYQVAMDVRHPKCTDTLLLEIFDGQQWYTTDKLIPNQINKALEHRNFDVSNHLSNKENVRIRFRISGPNSSNLSYEFYIKEVKMWSPDYKQIAGNVFKESSIKDAIVHLKMNNDIIVYSTKTDNEGNYSLAEVEAGSYTLSVSHPKYNELLVQDFIVDKNLANLNLELKQPKITLGETAINIKMSPEKTMRYTLPLNNSGDGDGSWIAGFEFPKKNTSKKEINEYKWDVFTAFSLQGNVEDKITFHQGYIRTLFRSGANYLLLKYSKFGDFLGVDTLPKNTPRVSNMLSDGTDLYFLQTNPQISFLYRYNTSTKEFMDSISFPKTIQYATYDPISKGFYIGDQYNLYLTDNKGGIQKTFNIGTLASAKSVILDTVTSSKHCLWIYGSKGISGQSVQGENIGIYQFSLDSNKYTGVAHTPNDFPGYTVPVFSKRQTCDATSMVGTYDYFTGKFVLIGSLKEAFSGSLRPSKLFVYDMGQSVKWIGMETFRDTCKAGMPLNYVLNFNTENTKHGDRLEATVRFNFVPLIDDFIVPITLTIDTTIDAKCFVPSNLKTTVYSDEYVDISFEIKDHDGSIVDESDLLGFNIRRNGIKINDTLISDKQYRDLNPIMGKNCYSVQAAYNFNCESFWSIEDTAEVIYAGVCTSVKSLDLNVTNQRHLTLNWLAPENEVDGISETFESYKAFSIDSLGEWELRDLDRAGTYGFEQAQFPHAGDPMSFIVFNPKKTRPIAPVETFQGEQVLACFSTRVSGLANNDWLISPLLKSSSSVVFNFMAKTQSPQYSLERIKVGYSMTGKAEEDFIWFNEGKYYQVPGEWTEYNFVLPAGAKYVVINCVTVNSFMLLLDNIYIGSSKQHFSLKNYQVWRNNEHITDLTSKAIGMNDFALEDGTYKYEIVATYTNGCTSPKSTSTEVEIKMTNKTNPVRNLRGKYLSEEKAINVEWSAPSWSDPQLLKYHTDSLSLGLGLMGEQPAPFYVAAAFVGKDLIFEMDYSFTGIEIGMLDSCKATAFVMCDGEFLTQQVVTNAKFPGFTTVTFDKPVKIDVEKTYLIGYKIENYKENTYPAGSDNGPLVVDKGNFISMDGWDWNTTTVIWGDEFKQNWNITAIIEIVANTEAPKNNINLRDENREGSIFTACRKEANDIMTSYLRLQNHIQKAIDPIVGYQLYKNGQALHNSPIIAYNYKDGQVNEGDNTYYVVTTYQKAGKITSDTLNVLYSPINIAEDIENGLQVYCKDKIITVKLTKNSKHSIAIHDLNGSLVERKDNITTSQTEFFMNNKSKGTYMVMITQGSMQICRKVIVL